MTKGSPLRLLAFGFIGAAIAICGWLAFTASARADDPYSLYTIEEREIGGELYEVMVPKTPPREYASASAYIY